MNYDFYDDMNMSEYMNINNLNQLELYDPYEGFLKGNAFKNEYIPYKNYKVSKVAINSEQEEMLFNISEYSFMMHDLNLLLDINSNNSEVFNKFNEYRNKTNELIKKYERKYGPLEITCNDDNKSFNWVYKWPWVN